MNCVSVSAKSVKDQNFIPPALRKYLSIHVYGDSSLKIAKIIVAPIRHVEPIYSIIFCKRTVSRNRELEVAMSKV